MATATVTKRISLNSQFRKSHPEVMRLIEERRDGIFLFFACLTFVGLVVGFVLPLFYNIPRYGVAICAADVGFWSTQTAFLGHDVGHNQVFSRWPRINFVARLIIGCCVLGFSIDWWINKHSKHHAAPNVLSNDPDIDINLLGFTLDQARSRPARFKPLIKFQHFLLWFYMPFQAVNAQSSSWDYLKKERPPHQKLQRWLIRGHFLFGGAYLIYLGFSLGISDALLFGFVYTGVFGFYNSMVFAPNHKGMMTFTPETKPEFLLLQILTARNILGNWLIDFLYGGLNYQVEHHVSQTTSRWNLKKLRPYVNDFCQKHEIPKVEVRWWKAIWDIFSHLRGVALELRLEGM